MRREVFEKSHYEATQPNDEFAEKRAGVLRVGTQKQVPEHVRNKMSGSNRM